MLQQQFKVDEPNRVWVSDITCFKVNGKYLYICVILDLFSRKVVAHRVSPKNSTYLVTSTFRQVYRNRNEPQQLMFHSDQGPQYTSNTFRKLLRINKVVQSFSKSSRPHDNAVAESFFASMKREEIYRTQYCSERQFMQSVDTYIEFYNTKRPHSTLNYRTPDRFELLHAQRKERTGWSGQRVQNWVIFIFQPPSLRLLSLRYELPSCAREKKTPEIPSFLPWNKGRVLDMS